MKSYNADFLRTCAQASRSPRAYVIIKNDEHDIYLTSHSDVGLIISAPDVLINNVISGVTTASESVTPEDGISVLGGGSITLLAKEFTDELRDLFFNSQETIYNNKVEIYIGDENLALDKYQLVQTLYVRGISNGNVSYTLSLQTAAFLTSVEIFKKAKTRVFTAFTSADKFTSMTVNSTTGFKMVQHDSTWTDAPSQTVGYLRLIGSDANGKDVVEYMRYTGKTLTTYTGITRNVLGTGLVTASGSLDGDSATEVEEVVHLDLPIGKLLIALLTGQLYGQAGQTLPDGWHCGLSSSDIDIASFENIGLDLWNPADDTGFRLWLDNPNSGDAKQLISRQILRLGLVLITNQYGQLACKRFGQVINTTAAQVFLTNDDIKNKPTFDRQSSEIRNSFVLQWGYRSITEEYSRTEVLIDGESQQRNNYISKPESIQLDWVRNYRLEANQIVKGLLDGMRSRKSSPPIKPSITCDLVNTAALELMDVVGLYMETFPDHTDVGDVNRAFEIQQIQTDWMNGVTTMRLYGASDKLYPLTKDGSIPVIDHTGWTPITDDLTGSFTDSGGVLTLTSGNILAANGVDGGVKKYYYDGVFDLNGQTLVLAGDSVIDCSGVYAEGATINGVGYGASGGAGGIAADGLGANTVGSIPPEAGSIGFVGGNDLSMDGVYQQFDFPRPSQTTRLINAVKAPYLYKSAPNLNIYVDADGVLQGLPDKLSGAGGSGGVWYKSYNKVSLETRKINGGSGGNGSAGLDIIANFFSYDINTLIDLSGADGSYNLNQFTDPNPNYFFSGAGSGGTGAALYIHIKDINQSLPNNADGIFVSRNGVTPWNADDLTGAGAINNDLYLTSDGSQYVEAAAPTSGSQKVNRWPYVDKAMSNATSGQDFSNSRFVTGYLVSEAPAKIITGVDAEQKIAAPTLTLTERFNTPDNGLGNYSTIVATVSGITDPNYSYTRFFIEKFDGSGKSSVEMGYALPNSNSAAVEADGSTYRIFAIPVSKTNLDGEFASQTITVKNYLTEPATEQAYALPPLKGLKLTNSIAKNNFKQFKSPNAEFSWKASSFNYAVEFAREGLLGASSGSKDPYFKDYLVSVSKPNGLLLRQESVTSPNYIYTYDKNKADNKGFPLREFEVMVTPRGQNNQVAQSQTLIVENPAPAAPIITSVDYAPDGIVINFEPESEDVDYLGVRAYLFDGGEAPSNQKLYTGRQIVINNITQRSVAFVIVSEDQFGAGAGDAVLLENPAPNAVSNIQTQVSYNAVNITFDAPTNDYDYNGVNMRYREIGLAWSTAILITATSCQVSELKTGAEYEFELTSVDAAGAGGVTTFNATTRGSGSNADVIYTVYGVGDDFATLNEALTELSRIAPAYEKGGFDAELILDDTHIFDENIEVVGLDLSWITISSSGGTIDIDPSSIPLNSNGQKYLFTGLEGAKLPIINALFDDPTMSRTVGGIFLDNVSSAIVNANMGFTYSQLALRAENGSTIDANSANLDDAQFGVFAQASFINVTDASIERSTAFGILAASQASVLAIRASLINSAGRTITSAYGSSVLANDAVLDGSALQPGLNGSIFINEGGSVNLDGMSFTQSGATAGNAIYAINAQYINIVGANFEQGVGGKSDIYLESSLAVTATGVENADITIAKGCNVAAHDAVNTTFSVTTNTISSAGIIYN